MVERSESPNHIKSLSQTEVERKVDGNLTPKAKLSFELLREFGKQTPTPETNINPFASPSNNNRGADSWNKPQTDDMEGWTFQGRKRHTPKLTTPRQEPQQSPSDTPRQETMPGGKRGQLHSEVPPSYFTSIGIQVPQNREPLRARVWPVLVRERNSRKETLVHSKNQAKSSLPLNIRLDGPVETEWIPNSAWADLIQRLEVELEEKALRYKLSISDWPQLE